MTEIKLPKRLKGASDGAPGTELLPGRNKPNVGTWLINRLLPNGGTVIDHMCGGGQLWLDRPANVEVFGCEKVAERVSLAMANGIWAVQGDAETWRPISITWSSPRFAIIHSPPFPNCNKNSGATEKQIANVKARGLHSTQDVGKMPNMHRVLSLISTWSGAAPVAIICKNYIEKQVEVNWTGALADMMTWLGWTVEWFWYKVPPGAFEGSKRKRNPKHRIITREIILIGTRT